MATKDSIENYSFLPLTKRMKDLTGQKFGRLVAVGAVGRKSGSMIWLCECECGNLAEARADSLQSEDTKSCGCFCRDATRDRFITHGMGASKEYKSWHGLLTRCYNNTNKCFHRYGARGITVCQRWRQSFENFYADMGPCPEGYSIERKNNDKGYSPVNCEWAARITQANNKRNNRRLTYSGVSLTAAQWSRETGLNSHTIIRRIDNLGWSTAKALTTPVRGRNKCQ